MSARSSQIMNVRKPLIVLFCLWHMAAVGLYALPPDAHDRVTEWLRWNVVPLVRPYIFLTSQWQQWNLFSPDPLREVTVYSIAAEIDGAWRFRTALEKGTLPWWRDGDELKLLRNLQDGGDRLRAVSERYAQIACRPLGLAPGTPVRLQYDSYVIPFARTGYARGFWRTWQPTWWRTVGAQTVCPPART